MPPEFWVGTAQAWSALTIVVCWYFGWRGLRTKEIKEITPWLLIVVSIMQLAGMAFWERAV